MRQFEILMIAAILPVLVWPLLPWPRPRWADYLPPAAVLLMVGNLLVEGYRWQMLPAYALITIVFLSTLSRLRYPPQEIKAWSSWMAVGGILGLVVWTVAFALPSLLPVPRLPGVNGPYAIGTKSFYLVDESREEFYTDDPTDRRELMIQLWYPTAADADGGTALYLEDLGVMGPLLAKRLGLPSFLLDHIDLVEMDAKKDVPLLKDDRPYPLLIFSHGLRGMRAQNTAMVRELVSQGFVVATIDHTYGNVITTFPDGRIAFYDPDVLSGEGYPPHTSGTLVSVWAGDIAFVLDELSAWNHAPGQEFSSGLDLSRVGVFGHSTGGGAAMTFCGQDPRCKASVGLDAWLVPVSEQLITDGLEQPFMLLQAEEWAFDDAQENDWRADSLLANSEASGYLARVAGADHYDFSDLPLLSPLTAQLGLSSDLDSAYVVEMVTRMTSAFFRQELLGDELLPGAMIYPEISLLGNGRP